MCKFLNVTLPPSFLRINFVKGLAAPGFSARLPLTRFFTRLRRVQNDIHVNFRCEKTRTFG